ncbi:MAG: tyrosine-protein kinase family protein [Vicinamibacteria bacterium]
MSKVFEAIEKARREKGISADRDLSKPQTLPTTPSPTVSMDATQRTPVPLVRERARVQPFPAPVGAPAVGSAPETKARREIPGQPASERTIRPPEGHMVSLLNPTSFEAEQYRKLRQLIERMHQENGLTVVAVTSPSAGDGKTTTAINLVGSLAQAEGKRVLLIDADLRQPAVTRCLGMRQDGRGLVDVVEGRIPLFDAIRFLEDYNLAVLPAGRVPESPYELLKASAFADLMQEVRQLYDYVVLDTPPAVAYPDCPALEAYVDGFLVVVTAHKTPRKLLDETVRELSAEKTLGLVFNGIDGGSSYPYQGYRSSPKGSKPRKGRRV